jgi:hypothetical protein
LLRDFNEEHRLRVFEGGVLVDRFGPKTVKETGGGGERPKEDLLKGLKERHHLKN